MLMKFTPGNSNEFPNLVEHLKMRGFKKKIKSADSPWLWRQPWLRSSEGSG